MNKKLSPQDKVEAIRLVMTVLNQLVADGALAGIVLTDSSYEQFKTLLRNHSASLRVAEIDLDPNMEYSFVVDGLLIMRGTQLNG